MCWSFIALSASNLAAIDVSFTISRRMASICRARSLLAEVLSSSIILYFSVCASMAEVAFDSAGLVCDAAAASAKAVLTCSPTWERGGTQRE